MNFNSVRIFAHTVLSQAVYKFRTTFAAEKNPQVMSIEETIAYIISYKCSVVRFGDGELNLIRGAGIGFQEASPALSDQLREIITSNDAGMLVCLPGVFEGMKGTETRIRRWWMSHLFENNSLWRSFNQPGRLYGNAFVSRPYQMDQAIGETRMKRRFEELKNIWKDQRLLLVEGEYTRFGVGNDLLDGASSVRRILCPGKDAFSSLDAIAEAALRIEDVDLCLVALGPTAKPLVARLHRSGRRAIDIGHLDIEYEWYLRGFNNGEAVPLKAVNERGVLVVDDVDEGSPYHGQIVARVP